MRPVVISHWFIARPSHSAKCSPTSQSAADSTDSPGSTTSESDFYRTALVWNRRPAGFAMLRRAARENFVAPVLRELFTSLPSVPPSHQCATFFLPAVSPLSYPLTFNYSLTTFSGLSGSTTPSFKERLYASHIIFILPALITCQLSHPHHPPNRLRSFSVDYKEEENGKCTTFMLAATDIYISISLSTTYARFPRIRSPMCNRIVTVTYLNQKNYT